MTGRVEGFANGDHVSWQTSQGRTTGVIKRKLAEPITIKGHHVAASPDNLEYLVVADERGAEAAHKPEALHKNKIK
jgi:hypothetical protein